MMPAQALGLALLAALALAACDRNVTGGSSGMAGTAATTGSSGGGAVPGATGHGISEAGSRSQTAQAGTGTAGGLGGNSGLGMTGSFPDGSTNSTSRTSVGNR